MPPTLTVKKSIAKYTMNPLEENLLERCLGQDPRAQKELYDRYKDAMYTLCYRITNDFELAQDALQEGFVGVFRGLEKFRRQSTLGAWIKTIIVRTAYKKVKKEVRFFENLDNVPEENLLSWGEYLSPEYLEKAIQGLPSGYRTVFILIEIEGYSHKEVAETMSISVGTSKSQLFHAKKHLQKQLRAWGIDR
ncbi:MAG: RNA polymerase sigma factor [Bacteroidia bacterium]|nr:RNA polymerase sigma factor [Bacteroidia bacterium]